ncbi:MAG: hypothetical protein ACI9G9_001127 [Psychromonas sp.]|jgi:hypothetical protein
MLVEVEDKIISTQIFERKFVCDLSACKGACCVEGDAGAPLTMEEIDIIEENVESYFPYMRQEGIDAVKKTGVFYMDQENEAGTTLVNEKACAFAYFENDGTAKCSIEKAHQDGKTDFKKPISCHLYPIRVKQINDLTAINYNEWDICTPACDCGANLDVPVYKFLKEPLIRAFGKEFYNELEVIDKEIKNA